MKVNIADEENVPIRTRYVRSRNIKLNPLFYSLFFNHFVQTSRIGILFSFLLAISLLSAFVTISNMFSTQHALLCCGVCNYRTGSFRIDNELNRMFKIIFFKLMHKSFMLSCHRDFCGRMDMKAFPPLSSPVEVVV